MRGCKVLMQEINDECFWHKNLKCKKNVEYCPFMSTLALGELAFAIHFVICVQLI